MYRRKDGPWLSVLVASLVMCVVVVGEFVKGWGEGVVVVVGGSGSGLVVKVVVQSSL